MKNVLFVSIAFPPKSDAEGLQVAKYLKYLLRESKHLFNIDAVTSASPTLNMSHDMSLASAGHGVRQTIELPIYENRYGNYLIRKLLPWAARIPDQKFTFHLQSERVVNELTAKPHLIYSRAFPLSSAVMAHKLKKEYRVPWIMHLSDPWADCPERNYNGISRVVQNRLELDCFEAADVICVTSKKTREFYARKYAELAPRIEYFPNVFDLEDAIADSYANEWFPLDGKIRIVHTGSLAGMRSVGPFLKALSQLSPEILNRIDVLFVGPADSANLAEFKRWKLPCVRRCGQVEYRASLEIQRSADLLLMIDFTIDDPNLRMFFPSKMLDYILAERPILALSSEGSEIQEVVRAQNLGTCISQDDAAEIGKYLTSFVTTDNRGRRPLIHTTGEIYSAQYNSKRLVNLFQELIGVD
jgi:glycosyltransferase involved in cell wall biosynthesis